MRAAKKIKYRQSISRRLIFYIVAFSSLITLLITAYQLLQEYLYGVHQVEDQIAQVEALSLPGLTNSLWNLYDQQIQTQLNDLIQRPDLRYLEISSNGEVVASVGTMTSENTISRKIPMIYYREDEVNFIGELFVVATLEGVYLNIYDKTLVILISNAVKTTLVSVFIFFIFQFIVTRHLVTISEYLRKLSPDHPDRKLSLNRRPREDELSQVVTTINEMGINLNEKTVSKKYVETIISSMTNSLIIINPDTTIKQTNEATKSLLGYEEQELIGKSIKILLNNEQDLFGGKGVEDLVKRKESRDTETTYLSKDGKKIPVLLSASALASESEGLQGYVCIAIDITERKQAEKELCEYNSKLAASNQALQVAQEQLIHSAKMASIGQVTAGLAHEINQPLGAIQLNTELVHTITTEENYIHKDELAPIYNKIHHQINRIGKIVQHLRVFSRDDKLLEFEETDIISIIEDSLVLFSHSFRLNKIHLVKEFSASIPKIECSKIHIEQVLTNLLTNAEHALTDSIKKIITLRVCQIDNYLVIEIEDTGYGITEENMNKIFDPFFTTKQVGEGTGLGMSISYGIIQSHKGSLTVKSKVGKGTSFTLSLPIRQNQLANTDEPAKLAEASR